VFGFKLKNFVKQLVQPSRHRDRDVVELFAAVVEAWQGEYYEDNAYGVNEYMVELFQKALLPINGAHYQLKMVDPEEESKPEALRDTFKAKGNPRVTPFALALQYQSFDLHLSFAAVVNFTADTSELEDILGDALMATSSYAPEGHWNWPPSEPAKEDELSENEAWQRLIEQLKPAILAASPMKAVTDWLPGTYHWDVYTVSTVPPGTPMIDPHFIA